MEERFRALRDHLTTSIPHSVRSSQDEMEERIDKIRDMQVKIFQIQFEGMKNREKDANAMRAAKAKKEEAEAEESSGMYRDILDSFRADQRRTQQLLQLLRKTTQGMRELNELVLGKHARGT